MMRFPYYTRGGGGMGNDGPGHGGGGEGGGEFGQNLPYYGPTQIVKQYAPGQSPEFIELQNQLNQLLNQGGLGGAVGTNPINTPFAPNPTGSIGAAGSDLEDVWQPGVDEAQQIYNLGSPVLDPQGYLDSTMGNLVAAQTPQQNPYLMSMLQTGQESVADAVMSSLGGAGRAPGTIDPVTGQVSDSAVNLIDQVGGYTNEFLGSQYQQDMDRAMSAMLGGGDFISGQLQMMQDQPWNNLQNYAGVVSSLTGSSPAPQPDNSTSGWDQLLGIATVGGALFGSSRNFKQNFEPVSVLDALMSIPVEQWDYRPGHFDEQKHIGPYAEDFREAFGVGNGTHIKVQDALGVALRAIQELTAEVRDLRAKVTEN